MPDTRSPYDDEVVDPYADDDEVNDPHEESEGDTDDDEATDEAPAKRKPGRPRKTPAP